MHRWKLVRFAARKTLDFRCNVVQIMSIASPNPNLDSRRFADIC